MAWKSILLTLSVLTAAIAPSEAVEAEMSENAQTEEVLRRHVAALTVEIGDRSVFAPANLARARDYIRGQFEASGLSVEDRPYRYRDIEVANLIATPPGIDAHAPYYLVGAHYDTVSGTPGADDNASAVAVMLELARRVSERQPPLPVRFAAFTLEEPPAFNTRHQGSRVFVRELQQAGALETVKGAVVLEMVGYTAPRQEYPVFLKWMGYPEAGDFIGIVGNRASRTFGIRLRKGFEANPRLPVESMFVLFNGWVLPDTRLSDHASFWDAGVPAVMITDTSYFRNPHYHTPRDRMETLDFAFMAELVRSLELALDELPVP